MKSAIATILLASAASASPLGFDIIRDQIRMEPAVAPYNAATSSWEVATFNKATTSKMITVALRLDDKARSELESIFWKVSDPDHKDYGKHLSLEELTKVLAIPSSRVEKVSKYFEKMGASKIKVSPTGDMLTIHMPVPKLETALNTKIGKFTHKEHTKMSVLRASTTYSLPEEIANDVAIVGELLQFPGLKSKSLRNLKGSGTWPNSCSSQAACAGLVQPEVIRERYNLPNSTEYEKLLGGYVNAQANSMAVAEFQGQYFEPSDLAKFSTACKRKVEVDNIVGGNNPGAGVEAELDIEYIKSVSPEIPLTVEYSSEYSLLNWANSITSNSSSALVHSVSYGNDEAQQTSSEFMETCNTAFMKAGTMGRSILFASGDQGVCGREGCGFGIFKPKSAKPDFPGGSPYITVVGGTSEFFFSFFFSSSHSFSFFFPFFSSYAHTSLRFSLLSSSLSLFQTLLVLALVTKKFGMLVVVVSPTHLPFQTTKRQQSLHTKLVLMQTYPILRSSHGTTRGVDTLILLLLVERRRLTVLPLVDALKVLLARPPHVPLLPGCLPSSMVFVLLQVVSHLDF